MDSETALTLTVALQGSFVVLEERQYPAQHAPGMVADGRRRRAVLTFPSLAVIVLHSSRSAALGLPGARRNVTVAARDEAFPDDVPAAPSVPDTQGFSCDVRVFRDIGVIGVRIWAVRVTRESARQGFGGIRPRELHEEILGGCCCLRGRRKGRLVSSREEFAWTAGLELHGFFLYLIFKGRWWIQSDVEELTDMSTGIQWMYACQHDVCIDLGVRHFYIRLAAPWRDANLASTADGCSRSGYNNPSQQGRGIQRYLAYRWVNACIQGRLTRVVCFCESEPGRGHLWQPRIDLRQSSCLRGSSGAQ